MIFHLLAQTAPVAAASDTALNVVLLAFLGTLLGAIGIWFKGIVDRDNIRKDAAAKAEATLTAAKAEAEKLIEESEAKAHQASMERNEAMRTAMEKTSQTLLGMYDSLLDKHTALRTDYETRQKLYDDLNRTRGAAIAKLQDDLKAEQDARESGEKTIASLRTQISVLEDKIAGMNDALRVMEIRLTETKAAELKALELVKERDDQITAITKEREDLRKQVRELTARVEKLTKRVADLETPKQVDETTTLSITQLPGTSGAVTLAQSISTNSTKVEKKEDKQP